MRVCAGDAHYPLFTNVKGIQDMIIYFYDGSTAECEEIEFYGDVLMYDHYRYVNLCDIERIESR